MWYKAYLIKRAMQGTPMSAMIERPLLDGQVRGQGHQISDYRLADKLLDSLAPMYREVPLRRARARLNRQEMTS